MVAAPPAAGPAAVTRVLVVEDDESTAEAIAFHLRAAGHHPLVAADGLAGLRALRTAPPDAVVLDLMLPGVDGWDLIRRVRESAPRLPIIVVTARTNEHDRVEALSIGADDVMAKPFSMRELMARVGAALRRAAAESAEGGQGPVTAGELRIDPERMEATLAGAPAGLTPLEFRLLWTLAEARDRPLSRDEIHRRVWGGERPHGDRSVDVLVRRLRRKVDEPPGAFTYVQTLHGVGYRFLPTPRRIPQPRRRPGPTRSRGAPGPPGGPRAS